MLSKGVLARTNLIIIGSFEMEHIVKATQHHPGGLLFLITNIWFHKANKVTW